MEQKISHNTGSLSVKDIIVKLSGTLVDDPDELSKYLIVLSANMWTYGRDRIDADMAQAKKWSEIRSSNQAVTTDGQADKRIKATEEWRAWQMAIVSEKTVLELIRSLKKRLQSLNDEKRSY